MSKLKPVIQVLLVALLAPWLYDRYLAFGPMLANRPFKYTNLRTFKTHEVKYRDEVRNCEDVIIEKSLGIAFLSCDPRRDHWNTVMGSFQPENPHTRKAAIFIYNYTLPSPSPPIPLPINEPDFHPLGLAYDTASSTLFIANHPRHRSTHILVVHVTLFPSLSATVVAHFAHPLLHAPNALLALGGGALYVTNDHRVRAAVSPLGSKVETFSGVAGGSVVYVDTRRPWRTRVMARVPFANGVARVNRSVVAVGSSSKAGVYFFEEEEEEEEQEEKQEKEKNNTPTKKSLTFKSLLRTPSAIDNLSADGQGGLLLAGHPFAPSLMSLAQRRKDCIFGTEAACACTAGSWAARWSEGDGWRDVYRDDGQEFCSSSTMVWDAGRGVGVVTGLYERGILVFEM